MVWEARSPTGFCSAAVVAVVIHHERLDRLVADRADARLTAFEATLTDVTGATPANASTNPSGWTVGGGIEWVVAGNWTAFAEYNYLDFGTPGVSFTSNTSGLTFPINIKQNINSFFGGHQLSLWPKRLLIEV